VRSSVITMLSSLFWRFFFFIKIEFFYLPVAKSAYQLSFTVVYRLNNVGAINIVFD